jgi:hypothetical protein
MLKLRKEEEKLKQEQDLKDLQLFLKPLGLDKDAEKFQNKGLTLGTLFRLPQEELGQALEKVFLVDNSVFVIVFSFSWFLFVDCLSRPFDLIFRLE